MSAEFHGRTDSFQKMPLGQWLFRKFSQHGAVFTADQEFKYQELARAGRLYGANTGAGTAIAPVTSLPTTTATWALYNGYASRKLVVKDIYCYSVSGTLGLGMSLLAGLSSTVQASAASAYASSVKAGINPNQPTSSAVFAQNVTLAGAPVWSVLASRDQVSSVSVGSGLTAVVDGMLIIPPGFALGATVLAPTGTSALFGVGFTWAELDLDL